MVTVNSHQVFAMLNGVIKISVPYVLIRGTQTGVCFVTGAMATEETKPKKRR